MLTCDIGIKVFLQPVSRLLANATTILLVGVDSSIVDEQVQASISNSILCFL